MMRRPQLTSLTLAFTLMVALPLGAAADRTAEQVTLIVDNLKDRLGIPQAAHVRIVETNSLGFSVEPTNRGDFELRIDAHFLAQLGDEELVAALAHELGHVWIYTHHPYLHTEALANQIASRVVTRESLQKLYSKLWQFEGWAGNSEELLSQIR